MRRKDINAYVAVFLASFSMLVVEIVASRILAPYLGVSLYTWTSIIGVVLAGLSVGNWLGGKAADRRASCDSLGTILLAGGLANAGILVLTEVMSAGFPSRFALPLLPRLILTTASIF